MAHGRRQAESGLLRPTSSQQSCRNRLSLVINSERTLHRGVPGASAAWQRPGRQWCAPRHGCHQPFKERRTSHLPGVQTQVTATRHELTQPGSGPPTTPRRPLRRWGTRPPAAECAVARPAATGQLPGRLDLASDCQLS